MQEHSRVRALHDIRVDEELVPAGATGTIVHVIIMKDGFGYDVEFTSPKHVFIAAAQSEIAEILERGQ